MKKPDLLFYFSDEKCSASAAIIPTLAALAKRRNLDFETYICTRPLSWGGKTLPFTGHMHGESFACLANFYDRILFVSLSSYRSFQFRRQILAWGGDIVSCRAADEVTDLYLDVFQYFGESLPKKAAVIPDPPGDISQVVENEAWLAPYFYYDLYQSGALGISRSLFLRDAARLRKAGVESAVSYCCQIESASIPVAATDTAGENDSYAEVTTRIAERWAAKASGIAFGDGACMLRWMAYFLRENLIPLYDPYHWREFIPSIRPFADKTGNLLITGCQNVYPHGTDNVMTEFARYGMFFDLVGVDPRHGFSIQKRHPLPVDWLKDVPAPWEDEYSDDLLREKIEAHAVPVCFLFYAADLGHLPVLPRVLDLMSQDGNRAGIAFPSNWYEYHPELLEQLYIPLEQGGVFPQLEPMLSSGGKVVVSESEGMIAPETLESLLKSARADIAAQVGERMVPPGYYPWQDASPFYRANTGTPQFDAVAKCGFQYYISYLDSTKPARILYDRDGMLAFNQPQVSQWFPGAGDSEKRIVEYEAEKPPWIILPYDMPFFGLSPAYLNGEALHERFNGKIMGMQTIAKTMKYVRNGGRDGNLFMLKPHELYRWIRLLQQQKGLLV